MMSYANYLYIAIRAAVDAGKSIMDIYNDPESDFGIDNKRFVRYPVSGLKRGRKGDPVQGALQMGDAVDRGPAGRYQRVYQEKRRVYREYRLGGERCARVGRHLCARPEGVVFRLLLCGCL